MNVATVAEDSCVEALIEKLDGEAKLIAIESKRPGNIGDSKNRCDVRKTF